MRKPGSSSVLNLILSLNDPPLITKPKIAGTNVKTTVSVPHAIFGSGLPASSWLLKSKRKLVA